jgi:hypothetical protein
VVGRIDDEHVPGELRPREALRHDSVARRQRRLQVLGQPRIVQQRLGLVVARHQPGVVAIDERDLVQCTELADLGEKRVRVILVVRPPRLERLLRRLHDFRRLSPRPTAHGATVPAGSLRNYGHLANASSGCGIAALTPLRSVPKE